MQEVMDAECNWACNNNMIISAKKTKDMWICFFELIDEPPSIPVGDETIERVNVVKLLGKATSQLEMEYTYRRNHMQSKQKIAPPKRL